MAGITNREVKVQNTDEEIKYHFGNILEDAEKYLDVTDVASIDRARYLPVLIAHFERDHRELNQECVTKLFEQCLADIDEVLTGSDDDAFTISDQVRLVHLAALAFTEMTDLPQLTYVEYTDKVLKWLARFGPTEIFGKLEIW